MSEKGFKKFEFEQLDEREMMQRSKAFFDSMNKRRSIREFSEQGFHRDILTNAIMTANSAPSGANKQPWFFAIVESKEMKKKIREAAEKEEFENYHGRMSEEWLADLKKFGTNHIKEFLELAPYLVVVFKQVYSIHNGEKQNNYYVNESVGIATGLFLSAIHNAGLVSLTHTPSPMNFLAEVLERPKNERAFLLIPVGFPKESTQVPNIERKSLDQIAKFY